MKYITLKKQIYGDEWTDEFNTAEEAIKYAEYSWRHLTNMEKRRCEQLIVIESANPDDVEADDHLDGDILWDIHKRLWYALQKEDDTDWGTGTYDKDEALKMLKDGNYERISVIQGKGFDPICIEEIWKEDL